MRDCEILRLECTSENRGRTVRVVGELDASTADVLVEAVGGPEADSRLVIDASELSFIDASGLRAFLTISRDRRAVGRELEILNPSPPVARLFGIVGFEHIQGVRVRATSVVS